LEEYNGRTNKVAEVNVSSDTTYVEFTNLDGNSAWFYKLLTNIKNPTANNSNYYIYVNGDTTNTNYYNEYFVANGGGIDYNRVNNPAMGWTIANDRGLFDTVITRDPAGYFRWFSSLSSGTGSGVRVLIRAGSKIATITNITSLRIQAQYSNAIGAGSKFILFKARRG